MRWLASGMAVLLVLTFIPPRDRSAHAASSVDLVLVLAIDVSGSVDEEEFDVQKQGLATAIRHPRVMAAIQRGSTGRIAVAVVQWAGTGMQRVSLPWAVIASPSHADSFAQRLANMPRHYADGPTNLAGVMHFATRMILAAPFLGARRVIDISGDGQSNIGRPPPEARDRAVEVGITINGLVILNASSGLAAYYRAEIIGGPGAFVVAANNYADYPRAILKKLLREIDARVS